MDRVNAHQLRLIALLVLDIHDAVDLSLHSLLSLCELGRVGRRQLHLNLIAQVVLHGIRNDEVAIAQTLHQCGCTETVGTVVGEVALAQGKQTLDTGLKLIIHPEAAHGVVDGGEDHHRVLVGIDISNLLIHIEEVAVALVNDVAAEALESLREVEEHGQTGVVDTIALVGALLGGTRGNVAGHEVTEGRIAALEVVVAVFLRNVAALNLTTLQLLGVFKLLRHPDAAVVTQRLRHQCELRLLVAMHGDTRRVNLNEAGIGEVGTLTIGLDGCGAVATHGVGRQEVSVAITAGGQTNGVTGIALELSGNEVLGDDATAAAVDDDDILNLCTGVELHGAVVHLFHQ